MIAQQLPPGAPDKTGPWGQRGRVAAVCLVLAAITFVVFGQTAGFGFVNYDDPSYVYENPVVKKGLTLKGAVWALTYGKIGHWHPLTWLTHMADCQVHGLWAGGHHLTNVILHTLAVVLLFLALREMTGNLWRSAFVAAVFAIHPLRAESVAWIAERKDVLSGVFFMLTLWVYAVYVRRPSRWAWAGMVVSYALGLLSKNTLVTLPFVLLLLDYWPLQRRTTPFAERVKEKIPFFLLSAGSCVATALVPERILASERLPLLERVASAIVSYATYLRQMFFPADLAIPCLYPPNGQPLWKVAAAFAVLAAVSLGVWQWRSKRPYLLTGWLWYLGMLVPAIGFIQISYYSHADRYTYLPGIGLVLGVTWAVGDWSLAWRNRPMLLGSLMAAVIGTLMVCACRQTMYWKDGETLWTHTLDCTTSNDVAHLNLGNALDQKGELDEAIIQYEEVLKINPGNAEAHNNLGNDLRQTGKADEAVAHYKASLQIKPDNAEAHYNFGIALAQIGQTNEAIAQYQEALRLNPGHAAAQINLGGALLQAGRVDEGIAHLQQALQINPGYAQAHNNLGNAFLQKGNVGGAISQFQEAIQIDPRDPWVKNNFAWLLATGPDASLRDGKKAVDLAGEANDLTGGNDPIILHTLAAALAATGRFAEAVETAQRAAELVGAQSKTELAGQIQSELKLYRARRPFHNDAPGH